MDNKAIDVEKYIQEQIAKLEQRIDNLLEHQNQKQKTIIEMRSTFSNLVKQVDELQQNSNQHTHQQQSQKPEEENKQVFENPLQISKLTAAQLAAMCSLRSPPAQVEEVCKMVSSLFGINKKQFSKQLINLITSLSIDNLNVKNFKEFEKLYKKCQLTTAQLWNSSQAGAYLYQFLQDTYDKYKDDPKFEEKVIATDNNDQQQQQQQQQQPSTTIQEENKQVQDNQQIYKQLTKQQLNELCTYTNPPAAVNDVIKMITTLFGINKGQLKSQILQLIQNISIDNLNVKNFQDFKKLYKKTQLNYEQLKNINIAGAIFYQFLTETYNKFKDDPKFEKKEGKEGKDGKDQPKPISPTHDNKDNKEAKEPKDNKDTGKNAKGNKDGTQPKDPKDQKDQKEDNKEQIDENLKQIKNPAIKQLIDHIPQHVQPVISMCACLLGQKPEWKPNDSFKFLNDLQQIDKSKIKTKNFRMMASIYQNHQMNETTISNQNQCAGLIYKWIDSIYNQYKDDPKYNAPQQPEKEDETKITRISVKPNPQSKQDKNEKQENAEQTAQKKEIDSQLEKLPKKLVIESFSSQAKENTGLAWILELTALLFNQNKDWRTKDPLTFLSEIQKFDHKKIKQAFLRKFNTLYESAKFTQEQLQKESVFCGTIYKWIEFIYQLKKNEEKKPDEEEKKAEEKPNDEKNKEKDKSQPPIVNSTTVNEEQTSQIQQQQQLQQEQQQDQQHQQHQSPIKEQQESLQQVQDTQQQEQIPIQEEQKLEQPVQQQQINDNIQKKQPESEPDQSIKVQQVTDQIAQQPHQSDQQPLQQIQSEIPTVQQPNDENLI